MGSITMETLFGVRVCGLYVCDCVTLCVCVCVCVCVHVFYSSQHHSPLHEWLQMQGASHAGSHS